MITDLVGRGFTIGDIVAFARREKKTGNYTYKASRMNLGVVRGISKSGKVLIRMPSGFEDREEQYDTWLRDEKNTIVLSQFVIPEIEQFQELFDIRNDLL